jgi:5-hydroxyisourate hydrolase
VADLMAPGTLAVGTYRITFDTGAYFQQLGTQGFYPYAQIVFVVRDTASHYHIPLLLSPYGYSTYRGS